MAGCPGLSAHYALRHPRYEILTVDKLEVPTHSSRSKIGVSSRQSGCWTSISINACFGFVGSYFDTPKFHGFPRSHLRYYANKLMCLAGYQSFAPSNRKIYLPTNLRQSAIHRRQTNGEVWQSPFLHGQRFSKEIDFPNQTRQFVTSASCRLYILRETANGHVRFPNPYAPCMQYLPTNICP